MTEANPKKRELRPADYEPYVAPSESHSGSRPSARVATTKQSWQEGIDAEEEPAKGTAPDLQLIQKTTRESIVELE